MFARWKHHTGLITTVIFFAALTGAFFDQNVAHAQAGDNDYVDVGLILGVPDHVHIAGHHDLNIIVVNHGSRTAYDVEVVVDIVYPEDSSHFRRTPTVPVGNATVENNERTLRWSIPSLGELQRAEVTADVTNIFSGSGLPNFDYADHPHEHFGKVTTSSFESELHKENNTARVWSYRTASQHHNFDQAAGNYWVTVSVNEPSPSPGHTVNFTITTGRARPSGQTGLRTPPIDLKVDIDLTDGLSVSGTPSYVSKKQIGGTDHPKPASVNYSNGVFTVGTLKAGDPALNAVTLPITVASGAMVNKQCLRAKLTGNPPPGVGPHDDDISDNVAKMCLGSHKQLFSSGQVDAFTIYPCVGDTDPPCDSTDDVRVRAVNNSSGQILAPGTAFFQVDPLLARIYDDHENSGNVLQSVNDGNTVSWQTSVTAGRTYTGGLSGGIELYYSRAPYVGKTSGWNGLTMGIAAKDVEGNSPPPGKVFLRSTSSGNAFRKAESSNSYEDFRIAPTSTSNPTSKINYFLEFEKLGTYQFTWQAVTRRSTLDGDENCNPDTATPPVNQGFCAYETYTFHVGPMADLAVEDVGASSRVAPDQNALTIVAVNNGPDDSLGARVTGLPTGAEVLHISQGSYDGFTGEWNIGRLRVRGYYRSAGESEPTLVLGASAGDTAAVRIASSKNYEVCVGPKSNPGDLAHTTQTACEAATNASWNSTPVYDYKPGNNTALITAARGTGGVGPGLPANPRTQTGTTAVTWDRVEYLYGLPVEFYQVQWLGSDWTMLDDEVATNHYLDAPSGGGRGEYRVRAVNLAGAAGPWSRSTTQVQAGYAGPPVNLRTQADGNNAILVSWDAPEDMGGSAITGYTVQWSADGVGGWSNAGSTSASILTYTHRGLQTGAVRWYRVAARNSSGLGLWSEPLMGQTVSGAPEAPTLRANALSDYQVELTWNQPRDNGQPIVRYEIEWSDDGSANSWNLLAEPGADATTYTDGTLQQNTRRYYRLRAVNGEGEGGWSGTASATTQPSPPMPTTLASVEADGPNAIVVTWVEPLVVGNELAVTNYELQWSRDPSAETWQGSRTFSRSTLSWRHTGLKPEETWYYRVRASNGGGRWSFWSYTGAATTASEKVPATAPSGLTATYDPASGGSVALQWRKPASQVELTGYDLQYSDDDIHWQGLMTTGPEEVTYTDAGYHLYPGAQLQYRVRAVVAEEGAGPWSRPVSVSVPPDLPEAPQPPWAEADGSNHILIQWEPPYWDGGAPITGYRLLWCRVLDGADENPCDVAPDPEDPLADPPGYSTISLGPTPLSYTHSVSPGYVYYYLLRATNGGNRWSEWPFYYYVSQARTYAGVPAAPGLTAQGVSTDQIKLTWTKPNDYGSEISIYWLYVYREGEHLHDFDNILDVLTVPGDRIEWTIGDLGPGTTRYFRIRALNENGEGKYSALRQATTPSG